jgi:3-oxoacyl-[acyl-carrier-protein] synthase II
MNARCVIIGAGLATPLGVGIDHTWLGLTDGRFISDHARVPVPADDADRVLQLATLAAAEATSNVASIADAALCVGTSKGAVESWFPSADLTRHPIGLHSISHGIATRFDLRGPRSTHSAACASGLHALFHACGLLHCAVAKRAVVVAAESSLHPMFTQSFRRLGVVPPVGELCRPLDHDRHGFYISEAAAALVIEFRPPTAGEVFVEHIHIASDPTHLTGTDPQGLTHERLLRRCLADEPVDLVHLHATATASDAIELAATQRALGDARPFAYSHKGSFGHTLGVSGLLSTVLNLQMHRTGIVPPMPTTKHPLESACRLQPNGTRATITRSLINAFGFGGAAGTNCLRTA